MPVDEGDSDVDSITGCETLEVVEAVLDGVIMEEGVIEDDSL